MAWTYGGDPVIDGNAAQKRDAVRFLAQENNSSRQRVSDAEIAFLIKNEATVYMAAAACADLVAVRIGTAIRKTVGETTIESSPGHYQALATSLRKMRATHQIPSVGGLSKVDKATQTDDDDAVQPQFYRGLHDVSDTIAQTPPPTSDEQ